MGFAPPKLALWLWQLTGFFLDGVIAAPPLTGGGGMSAFSIANVWMRFKPQGMAGLKTTQLKGLGPFLLVVVFLIKNM